MLVFLGGFTAVVAFVAIIWWANEQKKKRLAALQAAAAELGLHLDPTPDADHDDRFKQFAIFRIGDTRRAYNTMRGMLSIGGRERKVLTGDFKYTITSSNGKQTAVKPPKNTSNACPLLRRK